MVQWKKPVLQGKIPLNVVFIHRWSLYIQGIISSIFGSPFNYADVSGRSPRSLAHGLVSCSTRGKEPVPTTLRPATRAMFRELRGPRIDLMQAREHRMLGKSYLWNHYTRGVFHKDPKLKLSLSWTQIPNFDKLSF